MSTITHSGNQTPAVVDMVDELILGGDLPGVIGKVVVALYQTDRLPGLKVGDSVTIDGAAYVVRERLRQDEGRVTRIFCEVP